MTINMGALAGFLTLFVIYQIAEANGLDILHIPRKPLSTFLLFIGVIIAAAIVAGAITLADGLQKNAPTISRLVTGE